MDAVKLSAVEALGAALFWALDSDAAEETIPDALAVVLDEVRTPAIYQAAQSLRQGFLGARQELTATPSRPSSAK